MQAQKGPVLTINKRLLCLFVDNISYVEQKQLMGKEKHTNETEKGQRPKEDEKPIVVIVFIDTPKKVWL